MGHPLYTYPAFYELNRRPGTRALVRPVLRQYGGTEAVREFDQLRRTMVAQGQSRARAENAALYFASTKADEREATRQLRPIFIGSPGNFAGWRKKLKRGAAAILTGGASELAFNKKLRKKIKKAAKAGWSSFAVAVEDSLKSLKDIDSVGDAMNIVKIAVTGGASLGGDAALAAVQDAILELLAPYIAKASQAIGKTYGKGRGAVRGAVRDVLKNAGANQTVQRIGAEFVNAVYDLLLGYPPCVCERGCIKPVADGLARSAVPYVKAIGEALKIIYPIIQGDYTGGPQDSQALYLYASGEVPLLPNAKIPGGAGRTLENILDIMGDDYAAGVPQSFTKYQPYLIDLVARGKRGPYVYGSNRRAEFYFENPQQAQKVLAEANKIGGILDSVDRYLRKINRYYELGRQAYDLYKAIDLEDFDFSLEEWNSANIKKYTEQAVGDVQEWALNQARGYQDLAKAAAGKAKKKILAKVEQYEKFAQFSLEDAAKFGSKGLTAGRAAASTKGKISILPPVLGFGSTAQSFMGEWQPAQIGLYARARYNEMAQRWLESTPAQRKQWKNAPARRWRDQGIDYPAWHKKFSKSEKMRKMIVGQAAHKMPMQKLAVLFNVAKATGNPMTVVLEEVIDARGHMAGVSHLASLALGLGVVDAKQSAQKAVEEGLVSRAEITAFEGSKGKPTLPAPIIAIGAAITGVAIFTATSKR